ncbi:MAG: hypothetical protein U1F11_01235 [Steroidobacteraceae bacterium]
MLPLQPVFTAAGRSLCATLAEADVGRAPAYWYARVMERPTERWSDATARQPAIAPRTRTPTA